MNRKVAARLACVVLALIATDVSSAQRRGGAPPGGAGPGRGARASSGTVERVLVRGKALEGNREGDSPERAVTVYLPPGYAGDQNRRFPTVYLLHGEGGSENTFIDQTFTLQQSADRLAAAQGFSEFIVVTPNATTLKKGSMYAANSSTAGDWERFIAGDLVAYIDGRFRTLAHRMSRAIAGHDAGGEAALRIGMKHPEVFANLYAMSPSAAGAVTAELERYASNLDAYYAIAIDVGASDTSLESTRQLHAAMTKLRIPHAYEEYDGDRSSRIRERIEWSVLPFLARNLASPANLTSPSPAADRLTGQ